MTPRRVKRQGIDAKHGFQLKIAVEMREQCTTARWLPFQPDAERACIDGDENEIALAGKPLARRFGGLLGGREMDEAVAMVDGRAAIDASVLGLMPFGRRADFIDRGHR